MTYDTLGRLTEWRHSLTSGASDVIKYTYDVDNNVISVSRTDVTVTWHRHDVTSGEEEVTDDDGLVVMRRGAERLEWNSVGQLTRVVSTQLNSSYVYDAVGRLTVVNGLTTLHLFYSDLVHPQRITHIHEPVTDSVIEYFYDEHDGHLQAARINGHVMLYVAVDPHGSPICVFNDSGQIVRQMSYTPVGGLIADTGSTQSPWYLGYRAAFHDTKARLLFLDSRVVDTDNGRWLSPTYQALINRNRHSLTSFIHSSHPDLLHNADVIPSSSAMLSECCSLFTSSDSSTVGYRPISASRLQGRSDGGGYRDLYPPQKNQPK